MVDTTTVIRDVHDLHKWQRAYKMPREPLDYSMYTIDLQLRIEVPLNDKVKTKAVTQ